VAQVLDLVAAGKSFEAITSDYFPDLTVEDVRACLELARDLVENEDTHVIEISGLILADHCVYGTNDTPAS